MGLRSWMTASYKLLQSASKPGRTEFWLLLRVCILGIALVGAIGFLIRFVFIMVTLLGS